MCFGTFFSSLVNDCAFDGPGGRMLTPNDDLVFLCLGIHYLVFSGGSRAIVGSQLRGGALHYY